MPRSRRLRLGLLGGSALIVGGLAAGFAVMAQGGGSDSTSADIVPTSTDPTSTDPSFVERSSPTRPEPSPTKRPMPTPTLPPVPEDTNTGGDEPIGSTGPRYGYLPENANASDAFLGLRDRLAAEIDAYRASTGTEVGLAVTDLQNGATISINGNRAQRTGCTIHMFALFAAVDQFQAGNARPEQVAGSIRIGIGNSYPPEVMRFLQIVYRNFHEGEARGRELMRSWGMTASLFDHVAYYGDGTQNNLLTALETNMALTKLYRGELFDPTWTNYSLSVLRNISPGLNYIIPGQLPAAATVAHKIGYYADIDGWVVADAGIVTFTGADGQQKAYAITYLSQRAPTEYAGYSFGARLSRIAWDWMHANYGSTSAPPPPPTEPEPTERPSNTPRPTRTAPPEPTDTPRPTRTPLRVPTHTPTALPTAMPTATQPAQPSPSATTPSP